MCVCVCVCVCVWGGGLFVGGDYFKYSVSRGVIIRGRRFINGRLIFKQIRYTILSHHDGTVSVNVLTGRIDRTEHEVYIRFQVSRRVPLSFNHSLTKKVPFPLNSSNDALIALFPCAN